MADTRMQVVLGMHFSPSASQTYGLQRCLFRQRTRLQTTKRVKIFGPEELGAVDQRAYDVALWCMWYPSGARSRRSRMSSSRSPPTIRITPMSFLSTGATQDTGINDHPIEVTFQVTRWRSGYCSCAERAVAFDCVSEISITRPSKTGTCCLRLRLYPPGRSGGSDRKSAF